MSPDTKAIIDRLKAEGQLLRNTGTNSIKRTNEELAKFSGAFEALNKSMSGMKSTIQAQSKIEQLRDEKQFKLESIRDEKEREEYLKQEDKNTKLQQQIETERIKDARKKQIEDQKRDFKLFGKDGIFSSTLKNTFNFIKKALFFGIVGAIGYEVLSGAVEGLALKYFGKDVELPTLFDGFRRAGEALSSISKAEWDKFADNIRLLGTPAVQFGLGLATAKAGEVALSTAGNILTFAALKKILTPTTGDIPEGSKVSGVTKKMLRGGIAGLIFTGLFAAIEPISDWFRKNIEGMDPEQIANTETPTSHTLAGLGTAATIASFFVPGGLVARAIAGVGMFLIGGAIKAIDYYRDDDKLPNKIEEIYQEKINADKQLNELLDLRKEAVKLGADPAEIDRQIKDLQNKIAEDRKRFKSTFKDRLAKNQESITQAQANMVSLLETSPQEYMEKTNKGLERRYKISLQDAQNAINRKLASNRETIALNRSQMEATYEVGKREFGLTEADMGLTTFGGELMTIEAANVKEAELELKREQKRIEQRRAREEVEFQEYLKEKGIEHDLTLQETRIAAVEENARMYSGNITQQIINSPTHSNPIIFQMGGAKTNTQILQAFNQNGNSGAFCAFPGAAQL